MSSRPPIGDPRKLGGEIAGPGGPHDMGGVILDTRQAVLPDHVDVAQVDNPSDGRTFVALQIDGRINQSSDRARVLYLLSADAGAALVTQLMALARRSDEPWAKEFAALVDERLEELEADGNLS